MTRLSYATLALTLSFAAGPFATPRALSDDKDITVTGCLIKASNADEALLVTTLARADAPPDTVDGRPAERRPASLLRIVYWLDGDEEKLEGHEGRIVEIRGEIEGDIDRGEIKLEREDGRVQVEFKGDGDRRLRARLPLMSPDVVGTSGEPAGRDSSEYDVAVRKLDVKDVRMVAPTCDGHVR